MNPYIAELVGTMVLILLGDGVCAATSLEKSKAKGGGWVVIAFGWGLAVMCGVFIAGPYSGAHLNPAVSLAMAIAGSLTWNAFIWYVLAQMAGGVIGAALVWLFYKDHFDATENPDTKLGCFCTMPAINNPLRNLLCEIIGTWMLMFCIFTFTTKENTPAVGMGDLGAIPVTLLIVSIGMSLGGATGYAINPARDLSPRLAHAFLPFKSPKRDSGWSYSWIPVAGPCIGAALAALCFHVLF